jgi:zinc transport system substrate-binding protein
MNIRNIIFISIFFTALLTAGCSAPVQKKADVAVSILPQKYIVDRISGKSLSVMVMIPPGHSPATYEITAHEAQRLASVKLYVKIGYIMFEQSQWKNIVSVNKTMRVSDASQGIKTIGSHHHGHEHGHKHSSVDPHIWLSAVDMKKIAANTFKALADLKPSQKELYSKNYELLVKEIDALHLKLTKRLKKQKGRAFMVFHPAWTYFAKDYGLRQIAIEADGKEPGVDHIKKIIDTGKKEKVSAVLVQKQFPADVAKAIAKDLKADIVKVDPLAYNWFETMKAIADAVSGKNK